MTFINVVYTLLVMTQLKLLHPVSSENNPVTGETNEHNFFTMSLLR